MASRGRDFAKRRAQRETRKRTLVVTEGKETEIQYLQGLVQHLRATGAAVRGPKMKGAGRDPSQVLQEALALNALDVDGFDEVWIVVDVDEHEQLAATLVEARRRGVRVVVSNPCFEIWLLWHYVDCTAHHEGKKLETRLAADHGHLSPKHIPAGFPYEALSAAIGRAERVPVAQTQIGPNPSSAMPRLVESLQAS